MIDFSISEVHQAIFVGAFCLQIIERFRGRIPLSVLTVFKVNSDGTLPIIVDVVLTAALYSLVIAFLFEPTIPREAAALGLGSSGLINAATATNSGLDTGAAND